MAGTITRGRATFWTRVLAGVLGGVAGGLIFGMLMAMMGMLPIIASVVGMAPFTFGATTLLSLMGHLICGAILGIVAVAVIARHTK